MPIMNGIEVCRRLRKHPVTALIPIVFISHRYTVQEITEGFGPGPMITSSSPSRKSNCWPGAGRHRPAARQAAPLAADRPAGRDVGREGDSLPASSLRALLHRYHRLPGIQRPATAYESGDRLLKQFARIANSTMQFLGEPGDRLFHCGRDDFLIVASPDKAERIASHLIERFDQHIMGSHGTVEEEGNVRAPVSINICVLNVLEDGVMCKTLRRQGWELHEKGPGRGAGHSNRPRGGQREGIRRVCEHSRGNAALFADKR